MTHVTFRRPIEERMTTDKLRGHLRSTRRKVIDTSGSIKIRTSITKLSAQMATHRTTGGSANGSFNDV